jgi:DnaJ-class molecular chaperone
METRKYECQSCHGTGIYVGTLEPPGVGVVCNQCQGTGGIICSTGARVFTERKKRSDVQLVYDSISSKRGVYLGMPVSVEDFYRNIMPSK